MKIYSNGKDRILNGDFPSRFKLLNAGVEVPFIRTGKGSIRISGDIPFGELDIEEIVRKKVPQPAKLGAESLAIINKADFDKIDILNKKLVINQEQMNAHLSALTEQEATLANLETQNAQAIDQTNLNMVEMAKAFGKEIQADRDSLNATSSGIKQVISETAEVLDAKLQSHEVAKNPHKITKETVGLGAVDNTSDLDKPVSKATQKALDKKADKSDIENIDKRLLESDKKQDTLMRNLETVNLYGGVGGNELPSGGKKGQILSKKSSKTGDYSWIDNPVIKVHNDLSGRDVSYSHPISAISGLQNALDEKQPTIEDLDEIRSGASAGATAVQPDDVGNATLTVQKNGASAGTFTANSKTDTIINITVPTQASDVGALPDSTKYGASITVSLDTTDYKMTTTLNDQDGNTLGTAQVIDLPLESVVVNGSYDSANKKIVLTLQNGNTIDIPVGDLISGLQSTITGGATTITDNDLTVSRALISNSSGKVAVSSTTSTELGYVSGVTSAIQTQLNGKVPTSRTVNGKALSSDVSLTASDVGAVESNAQITGSTKCKITYDSKGLVTAGADLSSSDIPNLTLSKISDITATASELNVLDGITATTTELNYLDGVTSSVQTQLDEKQPTGNYMTTDTVQSVGAGATKTFNGRVNFVGTGDSKAIYLTTDTRIDVYGTTRTVLGFASGTFLINNSAYSLNLRGSGARPAWNGTSYLALTSDIGNATLTIQKNGVSVDTFNANATSDKTINITVPTNNNELTNGAGYQTSSDVASAISVETTNRENADIGLQQQIDAITASSDVKDIVGTYAQLQAYDTSTLGNNDIIKVLQDETHDSETTYYRWSTTTETFTLIGEEGPYYTKSESDSTFVPQTRTVNNKVLSSNITLTASDVGALPDSTVIPTVNNATLTIQKNGTSVATFTSNSSTNETANITVPTDTGDLTNGAGFITGITSSDVTTALGYTPYDDSNPDGYITGITSGDVTTALGYTPYNSTNPSGYQANVIETVKVNGTALTPSGKAVDINVPTNNNQLTNGAGYITSSALTGYATQTWVGEQGFLTSTALNGYATENWVGQQGFITGINSSDVTTALGYTPYDASNPNGYTSNVGTVTSVNNVSPVNGNVSLSIPTVNNSTITIQKNGTTVDSFTTNASSGKTINITVPTTASDVNALPDTTVIPTVNNPTITITQGGVTKGSFTLNQSSGDTIALDAGGGSVNTFDLFDHKWSDYQLNDQSWLRADTYSWQDGTVYSDAYNHLVDDIEGKTAQTETVSGTTVTYYLADDGHKIVKVADVSAIETVYAATGVAWYYVLDTANTRFKLPRTKYGFTGYRDAVGKYVPAGLPNITSGTDWVNSTGGTLSAAQNKAPTNDGCFVQDSTGGHGINGNSYTIHWSRFDASNSNSVYGNSDTVQPPATQMYLYFYVGQFSQSATEQTAGLNSSLFNGKMDLDMSNIDNTGDVASTYLNNAGIRTVVDTYTNGTDWYRVYSDGWCEQGGYTANASQNITLLVSYSNTNYTVVATILTNSAGTNYYATKISSKTSSGFTMTGNSTGGMWYACGY